MGLHLSRKRKGKAGRGLHGTPFSISAECKAHGLNWWFTTLLG